MGERETGEEQEKKRRKRANKRQFEYRVAHNLLAVHTIHKRANATRSLPKSANKAPPKHTNAHSTETPHCETHPNEHFFFSNII